MYCLRRCFCKHDINSRQNKYVILYTYINTKVRILNLRFFLIQFCFYLSNEMALNINFAQSDYNLTTTTQNIRYHSKVRRIVNTSNGTEIFNNTCPVDDNTFDRKWLTA